MFVPEIIFLILQNKYEVATDKILSTYWFLVYMSHVQKSPEKNQLAIYILYTLSLWDVGTSHKDVCIKAN